MRMESISTYFHSICLPIQDLLNGSASWVPFWKHGYYNISTKSLAGINLKLLMKISWMLDSKLSLYCIAYIFEWRIVILNYPEIYSDIDISIALFCYIPYQLFFELFLLVLYGDNSFFHPSTKSKQTRASIGFRSTESFLHS